MQLSNTEGDRNMKRKWWLIPIGLLAALLIVAVLCWQNLVIYIMPKAVLADALSETIHTLESRFQASPLAVLGRGLDSHGNSIALKLDTSNDILGDIRYEMDMEIEHNPRRIRGKGQAFSNGKALDLELYMDGTFAAISSTGLLQDRFYGIDYQSFARDLENNRILQLIIGSDIVSKWTEKVINLENTMNAVVSVPDLPQVDMNMLITALMVLDVEVEKTDIRIEGDPVACHEISYETSGAQILEGIQYLGISLPYEIDPNAEIDVAFYLQEKTLRKVQVSVDSDITETEIHLLLGTYDTVLVIKDSFGFREIAVHTQYDDTLYQETVSVNQSRSNVASQMVITYTWDRINGDADLSITKDNQTNALSMNLQKGERGFVIKCDDFEGLLHILVGAADTGNSPCEMEVTKGAQVMTPEYKPLHQWSMEDMVVLLSGMGELLGLKPLA